MTKSKLERAKEKSFIKFFAVKQETDKLIQQASSAQECGFCQEWDDCSKCPGRKRCREMEMNFLDFIQVGLDYLENDLLPWLKPNYGDEET